MTAERWQQIEQLYYRALEYDGSNRLAFLEEVCGKDATLRREVEVLLAANEQAGSFLGGHAFEHEARDFAVSQHLSLVGQFISRYEVLAPIGAGGMGEVYLARDTQLERRVALKLLPPQFTQDTSRLQRFIREAKAASALNHPNIITIHEVGEAETPLGRTHFIVTEFIAGVTLRERLRHGKPALREALAITRQIGAALAAAHEAGIVHRDIKPENVMVRPDGLVKVLDFGLARVVERRLDDSDPAATRKSMHTGTGVVMGTPRYMSPEQARGLKVDARSDVFSLGVVLYEMVSGALPFPGATSAEVFAALLDKEPAPLTAFAPETPDELERIVGKALRKEVEERHQTIAELLADLDQAGPSLETARAVNRPAASGKLIAAKSKAATGPRRLGLYAFSAVLLLGILGSAVYWMMRSDKTAGLPPRIVPFASFPGSKDHACFSPDGSQIAFAWTGRRDDVHVSRDIYIKVIGAGEPLRLTATPEDERNPVWSPDGRHIAFLRQGGPAKGVYLIPALGGQERRIGDGVYTLSWSADGRTLVTCSRPTPEQPNSNLILLSVETGEQRVLTQTAMPISDGLAAFSPDGKQIAFLRSFSLSAREVFTIPASGGAPRQLTFDKRPLFGLTWTGDSREIVFCANLGGGPSLWRINASGGAPERMSLGVNPASPAVSRQGNKLAWTENYADTNIYRYESLGFAGSDAPGKFSSPERLIFSTREDHSQQFSPDGEKIVFVSSRTGSDEIWVCDRDGGNLRQLTFFDGPPTGTPRWSPDGRSIVFDSRVEGSPDIYVISIEGGPLHRLTTEASSDNTPSWSRDSRWIYFSSNRGGKNLDNMWKMPSAGGPATQLTFSGAHEGCESPDGRLFYFSKKGWVYGLWSVPVEGGEEKPVPEFNRIGYWRSWGVLPQGIYFITKEDAPPQTIRFYSFATQRITPLATVEKAPLDVQPGLAMSPDGRWLLYAQRDQTVNDIMLMENFR